MGIMKKEGSQKRAGRLEGPAIGCLRLLPGGGVATLKATVICVVYDVLFRFRVTMETDFPPPSFRGADSTPLHICTHHTRTFPLPSTQTSSGLGRSEESEDTLERDSTVESGRQGCGFRCCLCPFLTV